MCRFRAAGDSENSEELFLRPASDNDAAPAADAAADAEPASATEGSDRRASWPPALQRLINAVRSNERKAALCVAVAAVGMFLGAGTAAARHQARDARAEARPQVAAVAAGSPTKQHSGRDRGRSSSYSWQDRWTDFPVKIH